jgi:8-oxo-dGTP pyrophosphatase MutT (NUDIX family)
LQQYPDTCYEFLIEGFAGVYGHLVEATVQGFTWDEHWELNHDDRTVRLLGGSFDARRDALEKTLQAERAKGTFRVLKKWTGERFPIYGPGRELILDFERSAASLLGVVTYGAQLIVYREGPGGLSLWLARRAAIKVLYHNRLGVTVGGSLPAGGTPFECVVRESYEEAGLDADLIKQHAKAAGTISYVTASETKTTSGGEAGLIRAEIQYIYHLKVGPDVVPKPYDMEASDISLYSIDETKKALDDGEFTPANACLILDFFIRHGLTTYENEENYNQIITRLHRPLGIQTA